MGEEGNANNNAFISYSSLLRKTKIKHHIDRIDFSVFSPFLNNKNNKEKEILFSGLKDFGFKFREYKATKSKYFKRRSEFKKEKPDQMILIDHSFKNYCENYLNIPFMLITIHDPDREIIEWFDSIFNAFGFETNIMKMEFAVDFYSNITQLEDFLRKHLFLKYGRLGGRYVGKEPEKSYYILDRNKNTRMVIVYRKTINGKKALRMELGLNLSKMQHHNFSLPLDNLDSFDLFNYLSFKTFNPKRYLNYIVGQNREKIENMSELRKKSFIDHLRSTEIPNDTVMNQIFKVKKGKYGKNYQRFFEDLWACNRALSGRLRKKSFLPENYEEI